MKSLIWITGFLLLLTISYGQGARVVGYLPSYRFYASTVGIPGNKLTLGVPFYGYDFVNTSTVNAFTYGQMVTENPASDYFKLKFNTEEASEVIITNSSRQIIYIAKTMNEEELFIDVSGFQKGLYFLKEEGKSQRPQVQNIIGL